ncbi:D-alanyl-D-alanine carboxypeptidase/D-alanyl-D-alanine-endopeptidase [Ammoniphilus sp. CFH 90114]|uniref:D-alanyl-D-alanine carboxypeptidase/D-alanyl-D-alanine endopeptidase n=1 Tax=Ammoniphilus sp. CFH 90114 TaxID=2493665 RepID=UPI00100DD936|nr:D-alanyl-D-alanine carboxypeptidase/D-alanyl-D-alanine-endopeptidase [Ammoniphilus sp. CFH 90114]RXT04347.1 D-alanyl-D-alanine carboxypeptidase/D-alanyl-D-alanine-endopeptidase [Ammoniphilus sp. CFH 90114]
MRRHFVLFPFILALMVLIQAAVPGMALAERSNWQGLPAQLEKLVYDLEKVESSKGIHIGLSVYNQTTQEYVYQYNQDVPYVPASNMKVWVSAAALDQLGVDYTYKTDIYTNGRITDEGVLKGDVILKGYGDPSFTSDDMQKLVDKLADQGIEEIHGNIVMDESYFDSVRLGAAWMWDDEAYDYSAQHSAVTLNRNVINYRVTADQPVGEKPTVAMTPKNDYMNIQNDVVITDATTRSITAERPLAQNTIVFKGAMGNRSTEYVVNRTMEDPALFAGNVLKHQLLGKGITLHPKTEVVKGTVDQKNSRLVETHRSAPLDELTANLNKNSDNLYAELFLKTLGAEIQKEGSTEAGLKVVSEFMSKAGVNTDFRQADGSGLSRFNLITTSQMVTLLDYASKQSWGTVLKESFPIAGVDGTLASRMKDTPAQGNANAKTGSFTGVNGLSGYVTAANGDQLIFSILLNGIHTSTNATTFQNNVVVTLASEPGTPAPIEWVSEAYALDDVLNSLLQDASVKGVTTGIIVKSLDQDQVLFAKHADKLMTPASNVKILTSSTALRKLGADYRFKTEVYTTAPINSGGVLEGDIVIKGYGDPSLHTEDSLKVQDGVSIESIVEALKAKGIKRINGNILMDDTYFDNKRYPDGWTWDNESYDYNPQISALGLNRGTVRLDYKPAKKAGQAVELTLTPATQYVQVLNEAKTVAANEKNTFKVEKVRGQNVIKVSGNLPVSADVDYNRVPVHEPALYTGTVLAEKLLAAGIKLHPKYQVELAATPADALKLEEFHSTSLKEIVTYLNKVSDNYYAEMITKTLGAELKGAGTIAKGIEVVTDTLKEDGLNTNYLLRDGSGLTRYDIISPRQVHSVLEVLAQDEVFRSTLPIAGMDGTLKSRLIGTPAEGKVIAKTGSLRGVRSLSGYVTTEQGERLAFSIIMNGYAENDKAMTDLQDAIMLTLVSYQSQGLEVEMGEELEAA